MNIITQSEVLDHAFTNSEAISPQLIRPMRIRIASERFIRPRFGDRLYQKFEEGEYAPFVHEYVKPALAYYVRYMMVDELSIQLTDNGALIFEDEEQSSQSTNKKESSQTQNLSQLDTVEDQITASGSDTTASSVTITKSDDSLSTKTQNRSDTTTGTTTKTIKEDTITTATSSDEVTVDKTTATTKNGTNQQKSTGSVTEDYDYHDTPSGTMNHRIGQSNKSDDVTKTTTIVDTTNVSVSDESLSSGSKKTILDNDEEHKTVASSEANILSSISDKVGQDVAEDRSEDRILTKKKSENKLGESSRDQKTQSTLQAKDDGTISAHRKKMRPATDHQRQIIKQRALADARILTMRAIRYIEHNLSLFPEYRPEKQMISRGGLVF